MPISTNTNTVTLKLISGRRYVVTSNGGTLTIETDQNATDFEEGIVEDGGRYEFLTASLSTVAEVKFTPSASGVQWQCLEIK